MHTGIFFQRSLVICGSFLLLIPAVIRAGEIAHISVLTCAKGAPPSRADQELAALALGAVAPDETIAKDACEKLRAAGQSGLDAIFKVHAATAEAMRVGNLPLGDPTARRLRNALDKIAMQRDAFASRLFWFTDLREAQAAARAAGRPILSLRLLGGLDTERSCANSRFFRTTLYANDQIAKLLRERFILHWKSVRPVPHVTIDFGDGRRLERTITGNSIHYVMDPDGSVIDALPGLFGAGIFQTHLETDLATFKRAERLSTAERLACYAEAHRDALKEMQSKWELDLQRLGVAPLSLDVVRKTFLQRNAGVDADVLWLRVAALHRDEGRLDVSSRKLLRAKNPSAEEAGVRAISKVAVESPLLRAMRNLEKTIAEDSVRNEYLLHAAIREWLLATPPADVEALNRQVYAKLFLTPDDDPWLGLAPRDTLTALEE